MNVQRIKETCIYIQDIERTKAFYSDKLRLPLISVVKDRHVFFKAGTSVLLCFVAERTKAEEILPPHGAEGSVHFAFEVSRQEYEETLSQIKDAGIPVLHQHTWPGEFRSFYFHDPDGNLLEVIEAGMWEADLE